MVPRTVVPDPAYRRDIGWLRAIAATEVCIWHSDLVAKHFSSYSLQSSALYAPIGGIGVELFFILSGYVICMRASSYRSGGGFLISRVLRLYPLYWLFTSAVAVAFLANDGWHLNGFEPSTERFLQSYLILPQVEYPILPV